MLYPQIEAQPGRLRDRAARECLAKSKGLDNESTLMSFPAPVKLLTVVLLSCVAWIAMLASAFVLLSGSGVAAGWYVAGALVFAGLVWGLVMAREIRESILVSYLFTKNALKKDEFDGRNTRLMPLGRVMGLRSFSGYRGVTHSRVSKSRPRKQRSRLATFPQL
jgi:hypothetical protein